MKMLQFFLHAYSHRKSPGRALFAGAFEASQMVCTKTLYHYVDLDLICIKNIELPQKLRPKLKNKRVRQNKKKLGCSIEERPETILNREEFGHWEADLVIGQKSAEDSVLLTLVERKSRQFLVRKIGGETAQAVMSEFESIRSEYCDQFSQVFQTITTDNCSEFASLQDLENVLLTRG